MSTGTTHQPNIPTAPAQYDPTYINQLMNALRLYFTQLDSPGPSAMATQRVTAPNSTTVSQVISALNFSQPGTSGTGQVLSLPTQVDYANGLLRVGDIYVDTSAGNVLKVRTS